MYVGVTWVECRYCMCDCVTVCVGFRVEGVVNI